MPYPARKESKRTLDMAIQFLDLLEAGDPLNWIAPFAARSRQVEFLLFERLLFERHRVAVSFQIKVRGATGVLDQIEPRRRQTLPRP
jgi:hypothetical protein